LDDPLTYEVFQAGDTIGVFQFESEGMQTNLRELKPTNIEDLIAMNALYRPGPMDYIPLYIDRKHGRKTSGVCTRNAGRDPYYTYGIMVYQEQIMQAAQVMGGFSLGNADILRKAMGKKDMKIMVEQRALFIAKVLRRKALLPPKRERFSIP
jgi:DNA polymerase III subunit alpha